jgi:hypothetical protein
MTIVTAKKVAWSMVILAALDSSSARAQLSVGTWVRQDDDPASAAMTMTVEACCGAGGRRLTYRMTGRDDILMTVETLMDGTDAPVLVAGKPSGETMGIKRLDERRAVAVLKMNGQEFGISRATISADGNTLTIENEITVGRAGEPVEKKTEIWVRK